MVTGSENQAKFARIRLREWAHRLPKIDLHRHLEGSLRLNTLADIAREHGIDLPSYDIEKLRPYVQMMDDRPTSENFLAKFRLLRRFFTSQETVQRIAREAVLDAAADNVKYLELRFNPVALARLQNFPLCDVVGWVSDAVGKVQDEVGMRTCLILQIGRDEPLEVAEEIVDIAIANYGRLVRGIDLAGDEVNYPPGPFAPLFQKARAAGVGVTVHAGEWSGAESIRAAVELLGAQRLGHGVRAVENSAIVRMLYERRIALEICPTSNLQTGVVKGLAQHPLMDLITLRLPVTINTDDPSVSDTTLTDEIMVAVSEIGLPYPMVYQILRNAVNAAFVPEEERPGLLAMFQHQLETFPGAAAVFAEPGFPIAVEEDSFSS